MEGVNAARLARGLGAAMNQKGGSLTLRLTPPELGTVRIELQMRGGSLAASFHAESEPARAMLLQQMSHLRRALESQGLSVERLSVQTLGEPSGGRAGSDAGGEPGRGGGGETAGDGRSRGSYGGDRGGRRESGNGGREFEGFVVNRGPT